jgi:hypothetical protein
MRLHLSPLTTLLAISLLSNCVNAQSDGASSSPPQTPSPLVLRAATNAPTSTNPKILVASKFTQGMADAAGLQKDSPQLSSDGLHSGADGKQHVASTECLLAETLVRSTNTAVDPKAITYEEVHTFCEAAKTTDAKPFEAVLTNGTGQPLNEALIHIVVWKEGKWTGTWYQYERNSYKNRGVLLALGTNHALTSPPDHLVARGGLAFLAIHLNIDDSCQISYEMKAIHTKPLNQQNLAALISLAKSFYSKGTGGNKGAFQLIDDTKSIGVWGGQLLLDLPALPADITFTPSLKDGAVVRNVETTNDWDTTNTCTPSADKPPKPAVASAAAYQKLDAPSIRNVVFDSGRHAMYSSSSLSEQAAKGDTPSDTASAAKTPPVSSMSGGALAVHDEGLHWWDVSVAMPVTSYKKLTYSSQNNLVTVKNTNDIKPYALFDAYIHPQDLSMKNAISWPMLSVGIPMSSQPLQKTFYGTGFIVAIRSFRFQPMVGIRLEKDTRPSTLATGAPATPGQLTNNLGSTWHAKLQVMLGFSVADAAKLLGIK